MEALLRRAEQAEAAALLGVGDVRFFGLGKAVSGKATAGASAITYGNYKTRLPMNLFDADSARTVGVP